MNGNRRPLIFDIKRYSLDDGPGIRTTVFFKGCPLSCVWCHNPESMQTGTELAWHRESCVRCRDCAGVCADNALSEGPGRIDRGRCTACGACVDACPSTALRRVGKFYPLNELTSLLLKDSIFYETSRGGVTVSGGEPTLHMDYLGELLPNLKEQAIHTAIQTCGMFDPDRFRKMLLPYLDLIYFDVKFIDAGEHRTFTGRSNELILQNLALLAKDAPVKLIPRLPLVPGMTATRRNVRQIGKRLRDLGITRCVCLPYNPGGIKKRETFGHTMPVVLPAAMMQLEEERHWTEMLNTELGSAGGETITNSKGGQTCKSIFTMR